MASGIPGQQLRGLMLGSVATSPSGAFAADTRTIFTVTGGLVYVTSLVGLVTTAITVADTIKLVVNPTTGDSADLSTATDLGTNDTAAGTVVGFLIDQDDAAPVGPDLVEIGYSLSPFVCPIGDIEQVTTGTNPDGAITWYATWIPLDDGALLVAG